MAKRGHTEEQIIAALHQAEAGGRTSEICRRLGMSQATFYNWRKQYSGLGVQEVRELRQLREENGRLKRMVADLSLDRQILQEIVSKNVWSAAGLQPQSDEELVCANVSGLFLGRALALMRSAHVLPY